MNAFKNAAEVRAAVDAAREPAMARFERDWSTRDMSKVYAALRATVATSKNPRDWAERASALTRNSVPAVYRDWHA